MNMLFFKKSLIMSLFHLNGLPMEGKPSYLLSPSAAQIHFPTVQCSARNLSCRLNKHMPCPTICPKKIDVFCPHMHCFFKYQWLKEERGFKVYKGFELAFNSNCSKRFASVMLWLWCFNCVGLLPLVVHTINEKAWKHMLSETMHSKYCI